MRHIVTKTVVGIVVIGIYTVGLYWLVVKLKEGHEDVYRCSEDWAKRFNRGFNGLNKSGKGE